MTYVKFAGLCAVLYLSFGAGQVRAQDYELGEIVISASKIETPAEQSSSSVSVISDQTIADLGLQTVQEILERSPGLYVANTAVGLKVFTRGARDYMTQIRFDDFPLTDPADLNNQFATFLGQLLTPALDLGRVEIIRNSAGSLYGSQAVAGVINLLSASGWDQGRVLSLSPQYGSFGTFALSGRAAYGTDKYYVNFSPMFETSSGFNGIWHKWAGFQFGAGWRPNPDTSLEFTALASYNKSLRMGNLNYDATSSLIIQPITLSDANYLVHAFGLAGLTIRHKLSDNWDMRFKFGLTQTRREVYAGQDGADLYWFLEGPRGEAFLGTGIYAEWLNTFILRENLTLLAGLEAQGQKMELEAPDNPAKELRASTASFAVFGKALLALSDDRLHLNAGGRVNYADGQGWFATYDLGAAYNFDFGLRAFAGLSSGYQLPSLSQIYNPWGASNFDLKPESSLSFEIGLEQRLLDGKLVFGATVFETRIKDLLNWVAGPDWNTGYYENLDQGRSRGYELYASLMPNQYLTATLSFTHTNAQQRLAGEAWQIRNNIPRNVVSASLSLYPLEDLVISATANWRGEYLIGVWDNNNYTTVYLTEKSALLVNLAASYQINEQWGVFAKINNLFDKQYTVEGYAQPGLNFRFGFEVKL